MKNLSNIFVIVVISISVTGLYYENYATNEQQPSPESVHEIDIPENVQAVLDKSCLPCHGADGSGKAKMKWNYEKMPNYDKSKLISKLVKVAEEVTEEKMPPPKNLKKHPDRKPTEEEIKLLSEWADGLAEELAGGE